jgi:serine/threonine protein kinase
MREVSLLKYDCNTCTVWFASLHCYWTFSTTCRRLEHPHIVRMYGIYTDPNNKTFIVTEYMSKGSLRELLITEGRSMKTSDLIAM